jgi:hypothetical protein
LRGERPPLGTAVGKGIDVAPKMFSGGSVFKGTAVSVGETALVGGTGVLVFVGSGVLVTVGAFESANPPVFGAKRTIIRARKAIIAR